MRRLSLLAALLTASTAEAQTFSISDPENVGDPAAEEEEEVPAAFQSTLFRGRYTLQAAVDTAHEPAARTCDANQCEDVFDLRNRLELRAQTDVSSTLRAVVEARLSHFLVGERPEDESFTVVNARRVKAEFEPEVREAWLRWRLPGWDLTVGNQVIAWGVLDLNSPQDVLNPVDYREGLAAGTEPPRIPILAARLEGRAGPISLDGVVVPFFEPHKINLFGSDFAILRPANPLQPVGAASLFELILGPIHSSREDAYQPLLQASEVPDEEPRNATVGLRAGTSVAGIDAHVAWIYGWDRLPTLEIDLQGKPPIRSFHERQHVLGADLTTTLGDLALRLEGGWTPERTLYTEGFQPVRKPVFSSGAGVDWNHEGRYSVNVEATWLHVDEVGDTDLYLIDEDVVMVGGAIRLEIIDDELTLSVLGLRNITLRDLILTPEVAWRPADGHELALALQLYEGAEDSPGGLFDNNDQALIRYTATF